jgi:hypothetical protein
VQLDPIALGLRGPAGPPGPSGSPPGTLLKDANGVFIGALLDVSSAIRKEGELMLLIRVQPDGSGFLATDSALFYYESPDCTGPAFLKIETTGAGNGDALYRVTRAAVDETVPYSVFYYPGDPITPKLLASRASSLSGGSCETFPSPFTEYVGPAQTFDLSGFAMPLKLE